MSIAAIINWLFLLTKDGFRMATFFGIVLTLAGLALLFVGFVNSSVPLIVLGIVLLIVGLLILGLFGEFLDGLYFWD